jgi:hypothetical protein
MHPLTKDLGPLEWLLLMKSTNNNPSAYAYATYVMKIDSTGTGVW